jgi:hypothetical protein
VGEKNGTLMTYQLKREAIVRMQDKCDQEDTAKQVCVAV